MVFTTKTAQECLGLTLSSYKLSSNESTIFGGREAAKESLVSSYFRFRFPFLAVLLDSRSVSALLCYLFSFVSRWLQENRRIYNLGEGPFLIQFGRSTMSHPASYLHNEMVSEWGQVAIEYRGDVFLIKCPLFPTCNYIPHSSPRGNGLRALAQHLTRNDHREVMEEHGCYGNGYSNEDVIRICGQRRQPDGLYAQGQGSGQGIGHGRVTPGGSWTWCRVSNLLRLFLFLFLCVVVVLFLAFYMNHRRLYYERLDSRFAAAQRFWEDNHCIRPTRITEDACEEQRMLFQGIGVGYISNEGLARDLSGLAAVSTFRALVGIQTHT